MLNAEQTERFVQLLTGHQARLRAFIRCLIPHADSALDVLQETNLVLWRKSEEFVEGTNFWAWASTIAKFQVLAYRSRQSREKLFFSNSLLENLSVETSHRSEDLEDRDAALRFCVEKLSGQQKEKLRLRYDEEKSLKEMAQQSGVSAGSVQKVLHRIRLSLLECVERTLRKGGGR